jgi:hypothetical protein
MSMFGGGVAQLGERLLCKQEVIGSIPFTSTINEAKRVDKDKWVKNLFNFDYSAKLAVCDL